MTDYILQLAQKQAGSDKSDAAYEYIIAQSDYSQKHVWFPKIVFQRCDVTCSGTLTKQMNYSLKKHTHTC